MRCLVALLVCLAFLVVGSPATAAAPAPKLVIVISVDQFASSVYRRYADSYTGGLKRLSSGIAYPIGYQSHGATETCPGHSTLLTGDHPSHTGIVANSWFEKNTGSTPYCVSVPGSGDQLARGPQRLKATTLGEWMKRTYGDSRVVSISGKDRAAITMAGHHPDLVAWWVDGFANEKRVFGFYTSAFAGPAGTDIQQILSQENQAIKDAWRASPPRLWPSDIPSYCQAMERPEHFGAVTLSGRVPPDNAIESISDPKFIDRSDFLDSLHASPLFDKLTLDLAADMAKRWKLGRGSAPDLLAISLSATDYVGHHYGNGGPEMCEQVHALDQSLETFLSQIAALGVPYVVVLTADHGSVDAPERLQEQGIAAERVNTAKLLAGLNSYLKKQLNIGWDPVVGDDAQQLYINTPGDAPFVAHVRDDAVDWLGQQSTVDAVYTRDQVAAAVPPSGKSAADLTVPERLNESYLPERSADIFVVYKKSATLGVPVAPTDYIAGHGSPWDYDRKVPILFWWPGAPAITSPDPVETVDIAPTLASLTGVSSPQVDGHCLTSVAPCR